MPESSELQNRDLLVKPLVKKTEKNRFFLYPISPPIMDTEEAKAERYIAHLKQENEQLRAEVTRLSKLQPDRKTNSKRSQI